MEEMIPTIVTLLKYTVTFGGGSLGLFLLSKFLGRKKEEVELALDWQKFYNEHIETIKKIHIEEIDSIKKLHEKQIEDIKQTFKSEIKALIEKVDELNTSKEESEKLKQIWENDSIKKTTIINDQKLIISDQETELETYR
tara:strand:+ start:942 stop:1361 length:420 start_codon:yes stop_codon:yes gene_type:complete